MRKYSESQTFREHRARLENKRVWWVKNDRRKVYRKGGRRRRQAIVATVLPWKVYVICPVHEATFIFCRRHHYIMSLLESPVLCTTSASTQSTRLSAQEYVLSLASLSNCYAASASAPTNSIYLFDKSNLQNVRKLPHHQAAITCLRAMSCYGSTARPLLAWSGIDGTVKVWDERAAAVSVKCMLSDHGEFTRFFFFKFVFNVVTAPASPRPFLCFDVSTDGLTVAAGTELLGDDALILYWYVYARE